MQTIANFIPHILFVISQSYCGASLVLLLGPLITYIWSGQYSFTQLITSFPSFWKVMVFDDPSFYKLAVLEVAFFLVGMLYAEFCYRAGRKVGYHRDLGLQKDNSRDANEEEQIAQFEMKSRMLEYPSLHRIWEWENFQTSVLLYAEYVMLLFCPTYVVCVVITAVQRGAFSARIPTAAIAILAVISSLIFYWAMRTARIDKYRSFTLAQRALENIFKEKKAGDKGGSEVEK